MRSDLTNERMSYGWISTDQTCAHEYLMPVIMRLLPPGEHLRIVDMGCGNGYLAGLLARSGHDVLGFDVSADGIDIARKSYPNAQFRRCSLNDDSFEAVVGGPYQVAIASEVIEHLYWPRMLLHRAHQILSAGGILIVTTPYHGYLKNLALSVMNGWDKHFTVEWDGGHIKFFSRRTLFAMMRDEGFFGLRFRGAGRVPGLWKSMVVAGEKQAPSRTTNR